MNKYDKEHEKNQRYYEKYIGDTRYEKVWEQMQLLGIEDVSTKRQEKNGTIVWRLPIKNNWPEQNPKFIEVASFKTGYVRNQNSGYSNYQLNKRCQSEPMYFKDYETIWHDNGEYTQKWTGKYRKFETRGCVLIPIEIDRLEYLIKYCVKNYYIKNANQVPNGEFYPKWMYESDNLTQDKYNEAYNNGYAAAEVDYKGMLNDLSVTVNGKRYKVI
tara:strand:+ start:264 stop:908 length:645 start_codon:yes stop_codon:yes gene_type:complete